MKWLQNKVRLHLSWIVAVKDHLMALLSRGRLSRAAQTIILIKVVTEY